MVIGLTGGSGAGKSTVAAFFAKQGIKIMDADKIARDIVKKGEAALNELVDEFGGKILDQHGNLNRGVLASIVFSDSQKLKRLNEITHPHITKVVNDMVLKEKGIIILDAPLLYEAGLNAMCDVIIFVTAPYEIRLNRIIARDGISKEMAIKRLDSQQNQAKYQELADFILENSGDEMKLENNLNDILSQIMGSK